MKKQGTGSHRRPLPSLYYLGIGMPGMTGLAGRALRSFNVAQHSRIHSSSSVTRS